MTEHEKAPAENRGNRVSVGERWTQSSELTQRVEPLFQEFVARHPITVDEPPTVIEDPNQPPDDTAKPSINHDSVPDQRPFQPSKKWREGGRELTERLSLLDGIDSKTVLVALIMLADIQKSGETWEGLSLSMIRKRTSLSRSSVIRAIRRLECHNVIHQTYPGSHQSQKAARYRFNSPNQWSNNTPT